MNQNYDDPSKQSSGSIHVKEIEVPKNVMDVQESWLNKTKDVGDVRNNITIIEPYDGTCGPKKIKISNLNLENIRRIKVTVAELMESSDSGDYESDEDNLNWTLI